MPTIREEDEGIEMVQTRHIKDIGMFDKLGEDILDKMQVANKKKATREAQKDRAANMSKPKTAGFHTEQAMLQKELDDAQKDIDQQKHQLSQD